MYNEYQGNNTQLANNSYVYAPQQGGAVDIKKMQLENQSSAGIGLIIIIPIAVSILIIVLSAIVLCLVFRKLRADQNRVMNFNAAMMMNHAQSQMIKDEHIV